MKKLSILYEDDWLVVVSKPAGLLSVGFPGFRGPCALDILASRYANRKQVRIEAVHRLDRDTSGIMMFAKSVAARERIMDSWQEMVTERLYHCVCLHGRKRLADSGKIDAPIRYNKADKGWVPEDGSGDRAVTRYRVLERGKDMDLVACDLETGRKNQIRIHLAYLGCPIAGDRIYGRPDGVERLALHARAISFIHPFTGESLRFEERESALFATLVRSEARGDKNAEAPGEAPTYENRERKSARGQGGSKYIPGTSRK